jgi:hypothetical protein
METRPGTIDISTEGRINLAQQSFDPATARQQLDLLNSSCANERAALTADISKQHFLGRSIDYLKNHFGTSDSLPTQSLVGGYLRYAWSYVLSYNSGSAAGLLQLQNTQTTLDEASDALKRNDRAAYERAINQVAEVKDGKVMGLKIDGLADTYDESQRRGVSLMSDLVGVGAAALVNKFVPAMRLLGPALAGAAGKDLAKGLDRTYFDPLDDTATGALLGLTLPLGSRLGSRLENRLLMRNPNAFFKASTYGHAIDSAVNGGTLNAVTAYENSLSDGDTHTTALGSALWHFPVGFAAGGAIGYGLGAGGYYFRQFRNVPEHTAHTHAADDGEAHVVGKALSKMVTLSRKFVAAEKASANLFALRTGTNVATKIGANVVATKVTTDQVDHPNDATRPTAP